MQELCTQLFPEATELDDLSCVDSGDSEPLSITRDVVKEILGSLDVGSANGASGWTNYLLRTLFSSSDHAIAAITTFVNLTLSGAVDLNILAESRIVFIPKKTAGDLRPLGIGDSWYRLIGRLVVKVIGADLGNDLMPHQLGVGVQGGCEIGARLPQYIARKLPGHCVLALDLTNAFGTIRRGLILQGVTARAPSLLRFFRRAYSGASGLVSSSGSLVGHSFTGVKQGDPLGSLLFCLGAQQMILRIAEEVQGAVDHSASQGEPCGVIAYMDDISIYCPSTVAEEIAERLPSLITEYGLQMAAHKSFVFGGNFQGETVGGIPRATDGIVCLGAPTSLEDDFIRRHVEGTLNKAAEALDSLKHLKPWAALSLLRFVFNARPSYLARVVDSSVAVRDLLRAFDFKIDKALLETVGLFNPDYTNSGISNALCIRSLPLALGGLGMGRHGGEAGAAACLHSREVLTKHLAAYYTDVLPQADVDWGGTSLILGQAEAPHVTLDPSTGTSARTTRQNLREVHEKRFEVLRSGLAMASQAAWLTSQAYKGSGAWLKGVSGLLTPPYAFANEAEFRTALRMRLLISPFSAGQGDEDGQGVVCKACQRMVPLGSDYLHLVDCRLIGGFKGQRHKLVADVLEYHIKKVLGTLGDVAREPVVVGTRRADLSYHNGLSSVLLDVGICSPCTVPALQGGAQTRPGTAADIYARAKDTMYRQLVSEASPTQNTELGAQNPPPQGGVTASSTNPSGLGVGSTVTRTGRPVWPLIWEATGRPGADVLAFLDSMFVGGHVSRKHLISALVQTIVVRYTARSIIAWARMHSPAQQHRLQNDGGAAVEGIAA
jgi:hypothetical protein